MTTRPAYRRTDTKDTVAEHTKRLNAANEQFDDWRGECARCHHPRVGPLKVHRQPCEKCGFGGVDGSQGGT